MRQTKLQGLKDYAREKGVAPGLDAVPDGLTEIVKELNPEQGRQVSFTGDQQPAAPGPEKSPGLTPEKQKALSPEKTALVVGYLESAVRDLSRSDVDNETKLFYSLSDCIAATGLVIGRDDWRKKCLQLAFDVYNTITEKKKERGLEQ